MDKSTLEGLLERVEKADRPDRELDRDIQKALDIGPRSFTQDEFNYWPIRVTASIDAALALVERVLPGWVWSVGGCQPDFLTDKDKPLGADIAGPVEWVYDNLMGDEPVFDNYSASASTAPLAILAALLKALIAQEATCASSQT